MELIKAFCEVLTVGMSIDAKRVFAYNQPWKIPPDKGLFIVVGFLGQRPFGNNIGYESFTRTEMNGATGELMEVSGLNEVQTLNVQESYWIDLFSVDASARTRQHEASFAMMSTLAQQISERHAFRLAGLPLSFMDTSTTEGSSRLTKFTATFTALRAYSQVRAVEYFDQFQNPPQTLLTNP